MAAAMVCAQEPTRCTIEGTITDAGSGSPIPNATLIIQSYAGGQPRVFDSVSDAAGKFTLNDLAPGNYNLTAAAARHAGGIRSINCSSTPTGVSFVLPPAALISGRVTDTDGQAVAAARVTLLRKIYVGGHKRYLSASVTTTDKDGQFTLDDLPEGTYYISAAIPNGKKNSGEQVYVPTFYPNALEPDAAAAIHVRGPGEIGGTDIRLVKARAFSIRGRLLNGNAAEHVRDFFVRLNPVDFRTPGPQFTIRDEQGDYEFSGVLPGSYTLVAYKIGSSSPMGRLTIDVRDKDLDNQELELQPNIHVTGALRHDSKDESTIPNALIGLYSWEDLNSRQIASVNSKTFEFKDLAPGLYRVQVMRLPRQSYAKALHVDGRDVPDWIADLSAPQDHTLEIVLGSDAGRVTGYARDGSGDPRPKTPVTLVPAGNGPLTMPQYATTVSDDQGRYVFAGVQPGAYKVFAWEKIGVPGLVQNRQVLSQFETQCADVEVAPNATANADVVAISASALAALE